VVPIGGTGPPRVSRNQALQSFAGTRSLRASDSELTLVGSERWKGHVGLSPRQIPEASVSRLPVYLRALVDLSERGLHTVSSVALAEAAGVNSAKIRKDLSYLGSYGTRGVGYDVEYLIHQISR
jgi:hypothetical protein